MKRLIYTGLLGVALLPEVTRATEALFENRGSIIAPPVVDATNFVNYGQIDFTASPTIYPFDTSGTWNYTNYGSIVGATGFRFEHVSPVTGLRNMAANFVNFNPGTVQAATLVSEQFIGLSPCYFGIYSPSYLYISASNIVSGAGVPQIGSSFIAGGNGDMRLNGQNVDLSDSGIEIQPVWSLAAGTITFTDGTFFPDAAIADLYWTAAGFSQNLPLNSGNLWNGFQANAPGVPMPPSDPQASPAFTLAFPAADAYTNWLNFYTVITTNVTGDLSNVLPDDIVLVTNRMASNMFKGAVFATAPAGFNTTVGFFNSPEGTPPNFFRSVQVIYTTAITNVASGSLDTAAINIVDNLASDTRFRGAFTNLDQLACGNITQRPVNYFVDRTALILGTPGNYGYPDPRFYEFAGFQLLYTNQIGIDTVTNQIVQAGDLATYGFFADSIGNRPPIGFIGAGLPGTSETNYPGRIQVNAANLNLENTRLRGEGFVSVTASHLVSSRGAVIDCENISFDLNSTNGNLNIDNVVPDTVSRMRGPILLWSGVWTNEVLIVFTNNYILTNLPVFDPPGSTNIVGTNLMAIPEPLTNYCTVGYAATMALADLLGTTAAVSVFDGTSRSRHTEINDNLSVVRSLLVEGRSLENNAQIAFSGNIPTDPVLGNPMPIVPVRNWTANTAPNLILFTNHGTLTVASDIHLGDDRTSPYSAIVNTGTLAAVGISLRSAYFQNNGTMTASGSIRVDGSVAKLERSVTTSGNLTRFDTANVKFNGVQVNARGALMLNVANSIEDAEDGSANLFVLRDGFQMFRKPRTGSLLLSSIQSIAPAVPSINLFHTWAGTDFGVSAAGYVNNVAVGTLALIPETGSANPRWNFFPSGQQNALYVDVLNLEALGTYSNLTRVVNIAPGMVIYYAAVQVGFTPPASSNGIPQLPEEFLNGKFNGRLRWVSAFAGPGSSTPVLANGQTYFVNRALANSQLIDSDGDGVPNGSDGIPPNGDKFNISPVTLTVTGNGAVTPDLRGQSLIVGQVYSLHAAPNDGSQFVGWSGGVNGNSPNLTFTMQSDLVINATFAYAPVAGTYRGLFYEPEGVEFLNSGAVILSTTTSRGVSGSLQIGKNKYSFKGQLDAAGMATFTIPRAGFATLTLQLQAGADYVTGSVSDGSWTAVLVAGRNVFNAASRPASGAGKYTVVLPGNQNPTNTLTPNGDGYGTLTLSAAGAVKLTGAMGDGTKLSLSTALTEASQWPFYLSLYGGKGQALGWITMADTGLEDMGGEISWIKLPDAAQRLYPAGFDVQLHAAGSKFNPLLRPLTGFSAGDAWFQGGNIAQFVNSIQVGTDNKVRNLGRNKLSLKLNPSQGSFTGSAVDPVTGKTIKFNGVLFQKLYFGSGNFPGTNTTGSVLLEP